MVHERAHHPHDERQGEGKEGWSNPGEKVGGRTRDVVHTDFEMDDTTEEDIEQRFNLDLSLHTASTD